MKYEADMMEARLNGEEAGEARGIALGKEQGIALGKEQGIALGKETMLQLLLDKGIITAAQAAECSGGINDIK